MNSMYEYDDLCRTIESCVADTAYKEVSQCGNLIIIALNEEMRLKRCVDRLQEYNSDINIVFVSQPAMESVLKEWYGQYPAIVWKGQYTLDVVFKLESQISLSSMKGLLFFTELPVNTRDMNFISIAEKIQDKQNIRLFSSTSGEELYEYHEFERYRQAIEEYERRDKELENL